jgi:type II secretory ATPase GspE/PulE/Tfp pilus assembly ATPase PilB-like protein
VLSQAMQDMVAHGASQPDIRAQSVKEGFVPMRGYGWIKVMQGLTTIEEVVSVTATDIAVD